MDTFTRATAVIIGAGIVGNAMAWHLAKLGWRDMILVDKGPAPPTTARGDRKPGFDHAARP